MGSARNHSSPHSSCNMFANVDFPEPGEPASPIKYLRLSEFNSESKMRVSTSRVRKVGNKEAISLPLESRSVQVSLIFLIRIFVFFLRKVGGNSFDCGYLDQKALYTIYMLDKILCDCFFFKY